MEKITVIYDRVGNTLDVWFTKPKKALCEEIGQGFIIKKDRQGNVLGFEKINYFKVKKEPTNIPLELVVT